MDARAVVRGPLHIFTEVDPEIEVAVMRPIRGVPFCEVFAEPEYQKFGELYDWARRHRDAVAFTVRAPDGTSGIVTLEPLPGDSLAVHWEPVYSLPQLVLVTPTTVPARGRAG